MNQVDLKKTINLLISATNKFDIKVALALFAYDAVIDDVSVGENLRIPLA